MPVFYLDYSVPDTVEGRFELIVLHCGLVVSRLGGGDDAAREEGRRLAEAFFADMDRSLREMGTGDLSVAKKMKKIASAFYGRVGAYQSALEAGDLMRLAAALDKNIYDDAAPAGACEALAQYTAKAAADLQAATVESILSAALPWEQPGPVSKDPAP